ncbi:glutathione S-transferase family protein [Pseudoalteromonas sp. R3]|uniref:glutathione S-transferase family protein n=1 Tax=Pseudoalteromonas sp. R3 TaxID=1709477 RepID=UPI0006B469D8|nr:glutathione S-transferase family protein [Pseudoalteromonas sp. R3]AZZ96268.1 glutathione S-transferase family protein [Pseudoalteromonas sp. R3]
MKLYGRTTSFNVQKVLWLLDELELEYTHFELGGRFGGLDEPAFTQHNPMKKVPVLIDKDKVVWESHTILRYLAASYGAETWYPACPYQRSLYERWMDWSQCVLQPAFMATFWGYYRKPPERRDMIAVEQALNTCRECLNILESQLTDSNYLTGDTLNLADVTAGAVLYRLTSQGLHIELPQRVSRWYKVLQQRAGYQKWVMSDFTELKAREDY